MNKSISSDMNILIKSIYSFFKATRCDCPIYLGGKTVLVTGASSGIGFETARILASRGARIIAVDKVNLEETQDTIARTTRNSNVHAKYVDLESLDSIRKLVKDLRTNEEKLDILINNAGVGGMIHRYTKDCLQVEMQINHFGPFLLTYLLIDLLRKSPSARIIFVSSLLAYINNLSVENLNRISEFPISDFMIYSNSKLCNIITTQEFAERLRDQGITCNSLHPGFVVTDMYRKMRGEQALPRLKKIIYFLLNIVAKTPIQGAQTVIHLAVSDQLDDVTGKFFLDSKPVKPPEKAMDKSFCESLWKASESYVGLRPFEKLILTPATKRKIDLIKE